MKKYCPYCHARLYQDENDYCFECGKKLNKVTYRKNFDHIIEPAKLKKPVKMVETLSPLEKVIEKINEQYMGNFTEGDKVVITTLHQKLKNNKRLVKAAKTDGRQIFEKNIFPQLFDDAAQEAYIESTETYTKLFEDAGKYRAIMGALAHAMFEELQHTHE